MVFDPFVGFVKNGCVTPAEATGGAAAARLSPMGGGRASERGREREGGKGGESELAFARVQCHRTAGTIALVENNMTIVGR
eukprot:5311833-Prorocentrum_lima.AAC.1